VLLFIVMLNVIMLNVIMLNVIIQSVIMLSVVMLGVVMLSVIILSVVMLNVAMMNVVAPFKNVVISSISTYLGTWSIETIQRNKLYSFDAAQGAKVNTVTVNASDVFRRPVAGGNAT
jgi:hypothetical protein